MKRGVFKRLLQFILCWVVIIAFFEWLIATILFKVISSVVYIITGDWLDDDFRMYYYQKWPFNKILWWLYPDKE